MNNDEKRKYIEELFKYVETDSILVIKDCNTLERKWCPFKVRAIRDVGNLKCGNTYFVYAIGVSVQNLMTVFIIQKKAYYLENFKIDDFNIR